MAKRATLVVAVLTILFFPLALACEQLNQAKEELNEEYVYKQLHVALGEFPKLAWVLPDGTVATESVASQIAIYSTSPIVEIAKRRQTLSPDETVKFAERNRIACDAYLQEKTSIFSLYSSSVKARDDNPQVLFTNNTPAGAGAGFSTSPLIDDLGAEVWRRMQLKSPKQLHTARIIRQDGTHYFYSFAALYQDSNQEVSRFGVFLHSEGGQIIASEMEDVNGEWCDGCAVPTFKDGLDPLFLVVNLYSLPQFKYPVLLLDTSTVEGRSLSLATFSPSGKYSSHVFYEYTVHCPQ